MCVAQAIVWFECERKLRTGHRADTRQTFLLFLFFFFFSFLFFFVLFFSPFFFLFDEIRPLYAFCTQYQQHHANDPDELERDGLFKKSKARVAQRDDMKRLRSEDDEKHKEHIDHDSTHDKTVASLLEQLDDVESTLHDECVITV